MVNASSVMVLELALLALQKNAPTQTHLFPNRFKWPKTSVASNSAPTIYPSLCFVWFCLFCLFSCFMWIIFIEKSFTLRSSFCFCLLHTFVFSKLILIILTSVKFYQYTKKKMHTPEVRTIHLCVIDSLYALRFTAWLLTNIQ